MAEVLFESVSLSFECPNQSNLQQWLQSVCNNEGTEIGTLTYIFCSDEYLLDINKQYLNHDYFTDVITFDYSEDTTISGDVFISVDRVTDNAQSTDNQFIDELHRVMVHGLLHLIGYNDKSQEEKIQMTASEDFYLSLRSF